MNNQSPSQETTNALQKLGFVIYVIALSILMLWYPLILFVGTFRFH